MVVESAGQSLNVDERNAGKAQLHRLTEHLQQDWRERAVYLKALAFAAIGAVNAAIDFSLFSFAHSMLVRITRSSHGYLTEGEQRKFVAEVAAARTDILWVCLSVPCEQQFYYKWRRQPAAARRSRY